LSKGGAEQSGLFSHRAEEPPTSEGRHGSHPRRDQMFPVFSAAEMEHLQRFGMRVSYAVGNPILSPGDVALGLIRVRAGKIEVSVGAAWERRETIITHGPGQFLGELAQRSGLVCLNRFGAFSRRISASVMPPPLRASAG